MIRNHLINLALGLVMCRTLNSLTLVKAIPIASMLVESKLPSVGQSASARY